MTMAASPTWEGTPASTGRCFHSCSCATDPLKLAQQRRDPSQAAGEARPSCSKTHRGRCPPIPAAPPKSPVPPLLLQSWLHSGLGQACPWGVPPHHPTQALGFMPNGPALVTCPEPIPVAREMEHADWLSLVKCSRRPTWTGEGEKGVWGGTEQSSTLLVGFHSCRCLAV